jgi:hypothetical protein
MTEGSALVAPPVIPAAAAVTGVHLTTTHRRNLGVATALTGALAAVLIASGFIGQPSKTPSGTGNLSALGSSGHSPSVSSGGSGGSGTHGSSGLFGALGSSSPRRPTRRRR